MIKITAVCGAGLGSSLACQMAIDAACKAMGVEAKVSHTDTTSIGALASTTDVVCAGANFKKLIEKKSLPCPVIYLDRLVDKKEIMAKLTPVLQEMGVLE